MSKNIIPFEQFEKTVMNKILEKAEDSIAKTIQKQYQTTQVKNRWFSGKGFFTCFTVSKNSICLTVKSSHLSNINGTVNGIEIGLILHTKDGVIDCLEGFTYGEPWPEEIESYELFQAD